MGITELKGAQAHDFRSISLKFSSVDIQEHFKDYKSLGSVELPREYSSFNHTVTVYVRYSEIAADTSLFRLVS